MSSSNINPVFAAMFPDSKIATSFQVASNKQIYIYKYIFKFRLGPFLRVCLPKS